MLTVDDYTLGGFDVQHRREVLEGASVLVPQIGSEKTFGRWAMTEEAQQEGVRKTR